MKVMRKDFSDFFPLGYPWRGEVFKYMAGLIFSFLYCTFLYSSRFSDKLSLLYEQAAAHKTLIEGAEMPDFAILFRGCLLGFLIPAVYAVYQAAAHYRYHYQGSKSIYLMRRLPRRGELHKRCLAAPAAALLLTAAAAFAALLFFFGVYHLITPQAALTAHQWQKLWS